MSNLDFSQHIDNDTLSDQCSDHGLDQCSDSGPKNIYNVSKLKSKYYPDSDDEPETLLELADDLPDTTEFIACCNHYIQYLPEKLPSHLAYLDCQNNDLQAFPEKLPDKLEKIYCDWNSLTNLPNELPHELHILTCRNNKLSKLPDKLPQGLSELECGYNKITTLPDELPQALSKLHCEGNKITNLPDELPQSLLELDCHWNEITIMPNIASLNLLQMLDISNNQIHIEPNMVFPPSLIILKCSNLNITAFDCTTLKNLEELNISNNNLAAIPSNLPSTLKWLDISYNKLEHLSGLPDSLQHLSVSHNNLIDISNLPSNLLELFAYDNKTLKTLPNKLPSNLQLLSLSRTNITSLVYTSTSHTRDYMGRPYNISILPDSLVNLLCDDTPLVTLPDVLPKNIRCFVIGPIDDDQETSYITTLPDMGILLDDPQHSDVLGRIEIEIHSIFKTNAAIKKKYPDYSKYRHSYVSGGLIKYIAACNEQHRTHERTAIINKDGALWECYMRRQMHPTRFAKDLLENSNLDIDEHILKYTDEL